MRRRKNGTRKWRKRHENGNYIPEGIRSGRAGGDVLKLADRARESLIEYLDLEQPERPELLENIKPLANPLSLQSEMYPLAAVWGEGGSEAFPEAAESVLGSGRRSDGVSGLVIWSADSFTVTLPGKPKLCCGVTLDELIAPAARAAVLAHFTGPEYHWVALDELERIACEEPELLMEAQSLWTSEKREGEPCSGGFVSALCAGGAARWADEVYFH